MSKERENYKPPGAARRIFERLYPDAGSFTTIGDLDEVCNSIAKERGVILALLWYWWQLSLALLTNINRKIYRSSIMLKNYLKITLRNIYRQKGYSIINISGLAIGLTCSIMILLWVMNEFSYDTFHENNDTLYIVGTKMTMSDRTYTGTGTPPALGPALKIEYPEIANSARLQNGSKSLIVTYGEKVFTERMKGGDFSMLEMFTFPLIKGNIVPSHANPDAIYISESIAEKYFGDEDPIGKILTVDNQ
ncbi:MAG: ABC transporter permease, partial [bacterium]|nr:ABC transporter permease [bacterium]